MYKAMTLPIFRLGAKGTLAASPASGPVPYLAAWLLRCAKEAPMAAPMKAESGSGPQPCGTKGLTRPQEAA